MADDVHGRRRAGLANAGPLDPATVLRIFGLIFSLGAVVTVITLVLPHDYARWDAYQGAAAAAFLVLGLTCIRRARRTPARIEVHIACAFASVVLLVMTWTTMPDLAGIDVIFLFLPLMISASVGPRGATILLFIGQLVGYVVVLRTAPELIELDRPTQWQVIALGLFVGMVYQGLVRRELERAHRDLHDRATELADANRSLRDADELQRRFIANAAHELRTPLTSVYGFASTLVHRWSSLGDRQRLEMMHTIVEQSEQMDRLVDDLLTLSQIEAGAVPSRPQSFQLFELLEGLVAIVGELDAEIRCDPDLVVCVDPDHVRRVLLNFLTNADKYGEPPITIEVELDDEWLTIRVCDAGAGVAPEFVPLLFGRFARASSAVATKSGTGLGLSISQGLAQVDGGSVWYEPNEPRGARFCLRLRNAPERVS